ncbi:MAG TPA: ATP-binding protein, partial [Tepidiformaceae bacterium]|nr:ATP-binding protein [Tepidiformaceae bacterium]
IAGPRQCGKSTLALSVADDDREYLSLDDPTVLDQARADPMAFASRASTRSLIIDEVQRLPELFPAIKRNVDTDQRPGRFLLTGSANYLALPSISESLAGRIEVVQLGPLTQGEIEGVREGFTEAVFDDPDPLLPASTLRRDDYIARAFAGGFPELLSRAGQARRTRWFASYVASLIQRDLRDIANVEHAVAVPGLLRLIAARSGNLANVLEISRDVQLPNTTLKRYLSLLEVLYLLEPLRPWSANLSTRLTRSPKFYLNDPGLTSYLVDAVPNRVARYPELAGQLLEAFAVSEVRRQLSWNDYRPSISFFRTQTGAEVDIILEGRDGRVVGIEVKAGARLDRRDTRGLEFLREHLGPTFIRGIVLYTGEHVLPAGERIWAMPMDALWRWGARPNGG